MDRLGHTSVDAAMRYQHVAADRNQEVASRIDDLLRALSLSSAEEDLATKNQAFGIGLAAPTDGSVRAEY
jgi:hypothetical protein